MLTPEEPELGDAFGLALSDQNAGGPPGVVIERDDGFIDFDPGDYLGGLHACDSWALERARGRVLDVGAGAGRASLALQERGQDVVALEVSPAAVDVCRSRGVKEVFHGTVADLAAAGAPVFDSVLMLGNNIGLLSSAQRAPQVLAEIGAVLKPGGVIVGTLPGPLSDRQARAPRLPRAQPARRADAGPGHDQGPVSAAGHGMV
ncbi:MAG TPA: methyltransferase domain-containing protein [Streptosporangiaceae bacterium]